MGDSFEDRGQNEERSGDRTTVVFTSLRRILALSLVDEQGACPKPGQSDHAHVEAAVSEKQ